MRSRRSAAAAIHALMAAALLMGSNAAVIAACPAPFRGAGDATYYPADGAGACSYPADPSDPFVVALNNPQWQSAAHCGECLKVTGPLGSVVVRVVDKCPECFPGDVDLHPTAFDQIANRAQGRVAVRWERVDCPVSGNIAMRVKDGSNPWWLALIPDFHRQGIAAMSVVIDGVAQPMQRMDYNAFVYSSGVELGFPLQLNLTGSSGETFTETLASLDGYQTMAHQFSPCDRLFEHGFNP